LFTEDKAYDMFSTLYQYVVLHSPPFFWKGLTCVDSLVFLSADTPEVVFSLHTVANGYSEQIQEFISQAIEDVNLKDAVRFSLSLLILSMLTKSVFI
jgi:hypothetical protein